MKITTTLTALSLGLTLVTQIAFANTYYYKYTFLNGATITGNIVGAVDPSLSEDFIFNSEYQNRAHPQLNSVYKSADGTTTHLLGWDGTFGNTWVPADGGTDGIKFHTFHDTNGSGHDYYFRIQNGTVGFIYENGSWQYPEISLYEPIRSYAWELWPTSNVPEGGTTLLFLGLPLIGLLLSAMRKSMPV